MLELVDKQLQQWLNVYVQMVLRVRLVVYVGLVLIDQYLAKLNILGDSCANFPCKNGGGCSTLSTDAGTGWSTYRCVCPPGFYGQNCDIGRRNTDESNFEI
jgi:hypothetical protein